MHNRPRRPLMPQIASQDGLENLIESAALA